MWWKKKQENIDDDYGISNEELDKYFADKKRNHKLFEKIVGDSPMDQVDYIIENGFKNYGYWYESYQSGSIYTPATVKQRSELIDGNDKKIKRLEENINYLKNRFSIGQISAEKIRADKISANELSIYGDKGNNKITPTRRASDSIKIPSIHHTSSKKYRYTSFYQRQGKKFNITDGY